MGDTYMRPASRGAFLEIAVSSTGARNPYPLTVRFGPPTTAKIAAISIFFSAISHPTVMTVATVTTFRCVAVLLPVLDFNNIGMLPFHNSHWCRDCLRGHWRRGAKNGNQNQ